MHWQVWELALYYSGELRKEGFDDEEAKLITDQRIYAMENQNKVPKDQKRRWILAALLDIPPVLFGLEALPSVSSIFTWESVDVGEYRVALVQYWDALRLGVVQRSLWDIKRRITNLHHEAPFANPIEKQELFTLLCYYYILAGEIARDQMCFDEALTLLSRAITIAEEHTLYDVWAFALRQRGNAYANRGQITAGFKGFAAAQVDFEAAACDMQAALYLQTHLSSHRTATIALSTSATAAWTARDRQELLHAIKVIDQAKGEIGKPADEEGIGVKLDQERYHLNRALAYLASPFQMARSPASARQALEAAIRVTEPTHKTRQADNYLLLTKSYLVEGLYPIATASAENALDLVKDINSRWGLTYIEGLYRGLRASPYGKSTEVAQLGIKLLRVQQPEMFT